MRYLTLAESNNSTNSLKSCCSLIAEAFLVPADQLKQDAHALFGSQAPVVLSISLVRVGMTLELANDAFHIAILPVPITTCQRSSEPPFSG
jgi:hypothetical protein